MYSSRLTPGVSSTRLCSHQKSHVQPNDNLEFWNVIRINNSLNLIKTATVSEFSVHNPFVCRDIEGGTEGKEGGE